MSSPPILLILTSALLIQLAGSVLIFDSPWAAPETHPNIASMDIGGQRAMQDSSHWWFGVMFGLTIIAFLTCCLTLAAEGLRNGRSLRIAIWLGGLLYSSVFVAMMIHDADRRTKDSTELLGPFPTATTWMVYGLWMVPAVFVLLYVVGFDRWFASSNSVGESATEETVD